MTGRDPFDFGPPSSPSEPVYGRPPTSRPGPSGRGQDSTGGDAAPTAVGASPLPQQGGAADDLVGRPPVRWLVASLVLGAAAAVLAGVLGADITPAAIGWFLAGPVGIALVAVYSRQDVAARARPIYDAPVALGALRWATGIALAVGIVISALRIAEWAGRL